jgi:hypothetical protein
MPESSFLRVILLLWSLPVIIYAILFFPERNHLIFGGVRLNRNDESDNAGIEMAFEYLLPTVAGAAVALIFGLLVAVSWSLCLMLMGGGAALIGGVAFTILQMHNLGLRHEASTQDRAARPAESKFRTRGRILAKQPVYEI